MPTLIIPRELIQKENELVVIPKKDYEEFLSLKRAIPTYRPTKLEIRDMERARENFKKGDFIEWSKLKNELDNRHRHTRAKRF